MWHRHAATGGSGRRRTTATRRLRRLAGPWSPTGTVSRRGMQQTGLRPRSGRIAISRVTTNDRSTRRTTTLSAPQTEEGRRPIRRIAQIRTGPSRRREIRCGQIRLTMCHAMRVTRRQMCVPLTAPRLEMQCDKSTARRIHRRCAKIPDNSTEHREARLLERLAICRTLRTPSTVEAQAGNLEDIVPAAAMRTVAPAVNITKKSRGHCGNFSLASAATPE